MSGITLALIASLVLFGVPGLLLAAVLRPRGYPPLLSLGLFVAGWVVVFANLAAVAGYRLGLFLAAHVAVTIALAAWAWRERGLPGLWQAARRVPAWQWLFYAALAVFFIAPAFVLHVPLDTDAQGFGYLVLTIRLSGSITSLAPFHPEINYLYSPGYLLVTAFLSDLTHAPIHEVMLGFSHLAAFGVALAAFELGRETIGEAGGHFMALGVALGLGLFTTLMDAAYTNVFGIYLTAVFLTLFFRTIRQPQPSATSSITNYQLPLPNSQLLTRNPPNLRSLILPALALASLPLAHPDSIVHLLLVYLLFYLTFWLARPRPSRGQYVQTMIAVPFLALLLTVPWVIRVLPLVSGVHVKEHLFASWSYYRALLEFHGPPILLAALIGAVLAVRRRSPADVWMLTWLIPIVEFGFDGSLDRWALGTGFDPFQIMYPFGIVWHALILPLAYFAALALDAAARALRQAGLASVLARLLAPAAVVAIALGLAAVAFSGSIIARSKGATQITGAYSSPADLQAMLWLRANTPPDTLVLNYPDYESHWVPIIAERNAVYFRPQLFFIGDEPAQRQWADLAPAYLDPAAPGSEERLRAYGVDYVLVPQIVSRPELFPQMLRWRRPDLPPQRSSFDEVDYLDLVADFDGALIYQVAHE